jgi:ABC-type phosphate transport system substrate-binding protein
MRAGRAGTLLLVAGLLAAPAGADELVVIVHGGRQASLTALELARIYLRQRRYWKDGERIIPVNRDSGSEDRRLFDRRVFGEDAERLVVYWNRQYFRGVLPPATLASDEAVRRFVASEPRAIGYVRASLATVGVRVVLRLPDDD